MREQFLNKFKKLESTNNIVSLTSKTILMGKSIEAVKSIIENWKSLQSISICIDEEDLLFDIILSARKSTVQNLKIKYYWDSDDYDTLV